VNIPFDITAGKGPIIADPIRTMEASFACWCTNAPKLQLVICSPERPRLHCSLQPVCWLHVGQMQLLTSLHCTSAPLNAFCKARRDSNCPSSTHLSLLQQVKKMTPLDPEAVTPFVGEALRRLRAEVCMGSLMMDADGQTNGAKQQL